MLVVLSSVLPVFLTIGLGAVFKRARFPDPSLWRQADRLNYFVLMPCLLIHAIGTADFSKVALGSFVGTVLCAILTMIAILTVLRPYLRVPGPQYSSIFQASARWNSFVALATVAAVYGNEGLGPAGIAMAALIPVLNIACVLTLVRHASNEPPRGIALLAVLARNPLLIACAIGILIKLLGLTLPGLIDSFLAFVGRASLPLGLLSVGTALNLSAIKGKSFHIAFATGLRLIGMPILMLAWAALFGVTGMPLGVLVIAASVPTAMASYVLSGQLGGDVELMASLITASTLASVFTMPVWIALFAPVPG